MSVVCDDWGLEKYRGFPAEKLHPTAVPPVPQLYSSLHNHYALMIMMIIISQGQPSGAATACQCSASTSTSFDLQLLYI